MRAAPHLALAYLGAVLLGALCTAYSVWEADHHLRAQALHEVRILAGSLDTRAVLSLSATRADLRNPAYPPLKRCLGDLAATLEGGGELALLLRRPDGALVYLLDSAPQDTVRESLPGQVFSLPDSSQPGDLPWTEGTTGPFQVEGASQMRTLVPLRDPGDGVPGVALAWTRPARPWLMSVARAGAVPLLMTLAMLLVLALGRYLLTRRPRGPSDYPYGEVAWIAIMGAVITLGSSWLVYQFAARSYGEAFARLADTELVAVQEALQRVCENELGGLARALESNAVVDELGFRNATQYLVGDSAVQAWEWAPAIRAAYLAEFRRAMAANHTGFTVWQRDEFGIHQEVAGRDLYFPVAYVQPQAGNESVLGYDPSSEPLLRQVIEDAAASRAPRMTPPLTLMQAVGDQKGCVLCRPLFDANEPDRLRGVVAAVLKMGTLLEPLAGGPHGDQAQRRVELSQTGRDGTLDLLSATGAPQPSGAVTTTRCFHFAGRTLVLRVSGGSRAVVPPPLVALLIALASGLALSGLVAYLVGIVVLQRRRLEQMVERRTLQARDSEETFRRLFRNNPLPMALSLLSDRRFVDVNEALLQRTGYTREELLGRSAREVGLFPDVDAQNTVAESLRRTGRIAEVAVKVRTKQGNLLDCLFSGEVVRHQEDLHYLTVMVDVTPLKVAAVERSRLVTAVEQADETIVVTDNNGTVLYANPAFTLITGYTCAEAVGRRISTLLKSGAHDDAFYRDMWFTISSGRVWKGRFINRRKDGSRYTEQATISPVRDGSGAIINYVAVKRDVTHELKLERQFLQSQKMEMVGRLAGGVAHDFNNMLGVILGYTEMALARVKPDDPLHADLGEVRASAWRTAELTRQLLAFARKQTVLPRLMDLNEAVEALVPMLKRLLGEEIRCDWNPGHELWNVRLDPTQVDQALACLVANAREAIKGVGVVTLSTRNEVLDRAFCEEHEGAYPGDYVLLRLSDTGCGMEPEVLAHIFEPFFTTKEVGEGPGLGLATVYGIVKQNQGFITVESKPGSGSVFSLYFPRQAALHEEAVRAAESEPVRGHRETLLLVEDDKAVLAMTQQMLESLNYRVLGTTSASEALGFVRREGATIRLVIADVVMPEMSGPELVRQLGYILPGLPSLYVSSYPAAVVASHGVVDSQSYLQKPYLITVLATRIHKLLTRRLD